MIERIVEVISDPIDIEFNKDVDIAGLLILLRNSVRLDVDDFLRENDDKYIYKEVLIEFDENGRPT